MSGQSLGLGSTSEQINLECRPVDKVMNLERLGAIHQSRISFMRSLIRRIAEQNWKIEPELFELDRDGYGTVIYRITTPNKFYSFVLFSNYLSPEERNDRVIATKWDLSMAMIDGEVDPELLENLRTNVPLQEAGRVNARVFVLSRANRSARNFDSIIDSLANGQQPSIDQISRVGYLYRTTAVYGSGKLGMADWEKVESRHKDFATPFAAEMFVCYMLRNFSLAQVEHIARQKAPDTFVPMDREIKRFIGIGNSTGLGMAPYLINHPLLINQWVATREKALARVCALGKIDDQITSRFKALIERAGLHTQQTLTEDEWQTENNMLVLEDLAKTAQYVESGIVGWTDLLNWSEEYCSLQGQELLVSIVLELYPELVNDLENDQSVIEDYQIEPSMPLRELQSLIDSRYRWVYRYDFDAPGARDTFWYRSEEKMEPRLGYINEQDGQDKQMPLGIAYAVYQCSKALKAYVDKHPEATTASFLMEQPEHRGTVRRIQTMGRCEYGEIQANLLDREILPMHLLRAKLAFFGVGKFDPRSKLWVRNTMFQGAPLLDELNLPNYDDWFLPTAPEVKN